MLEMLSVLTGSAVLMVIAYEFSIQSNREWGENQKSVF